MFYNFILFCITTTIVLAQNLPTNYEYFTLNGIKTGLSANQPYFTLNGKNASIYSGAMHYFRVPRAYWRDRLKKIRAAGLNTVETYIPWNLHEYQSGVYDFGDGGSEMQDFLHLEEFLRIAQEEDLFVIVRSGPYICAEYNFGGFPAWLLREENIAFRTSDSVYMGYVTRYFNVLLPLLGKHHFIKGGPIIMFQVENEYGNQEFGKFLPDKLYMKQLRQLFVKNNIVELLVTSDSALSHGDKGTIPEFLQTVNFGAAPEKQFDKLKELQPEKPFMAMEFWTGWFDHVTEIHNTRPSDKFHNIYERILKYPASVNMYMFHGGTNFYFTNGANLGNTLLDNSGFRPITTSYDYDAPLSETGAYTQKYYSVKELLQKYNPIKTFTPELPEIIPPVSYPKTKIYKELALKKAIDNQPPYNISSKKVISFEDFPINSNSGQMYGYAVYRKMNIDIPANGVLTIKGHVCDTVMVLINGELISPKLTKSSDLDGFGYWRQKDSHLTLTNKEIKNVTLDLLVEEWGRMNGGKMIQYNHTQKGLWQGGVFINNNEILDWNIIPLEFKKNWTNTLDGWSKPTRFNGPTLYQAMLNIEEEPRDTFMDMRKWTKGIVIVHGFVLGRYAKIGPQQTLYLPAPFLRKGLNPILIFEHFEGNSEISFVDKPIFETY